MNMRACVVCVPHVQAKTPAGKCCFHLSSKVANTTKKGPTGHISTLSLSILLLLVPLSTVVNQTQMAAIQTQLTVAIQNSVDSCHPDSADSCHESVQATDRHLKGGQQLSTGFC